MSTLTSHAASHSLSSSPNTLNCCPTSPFHVHSHGHPSSTAAPTTGSSTKGTLGLPAKGMASISTSIESDSKRNGSVRDSLNVCEDPYASFYALNRTLTQPPPPPPPPTGASPFHLINQSPNQTLDFVANSTGEYPRLREVNEKESERSSVQVIQTVVHSRRSKLVLFS